MSVLCACFRIYGRVEDLEQANADQERIINDLQEALLKLEESREAERSGLPRLNQDK